MNAARYMRRALASLTSWEKVELRKRWRALARHAGYSTARSSMRETAVSLVTTSYLDTRRPLVQTSEGIAAACAQDVGAKWGVSRSTADAALYDLRAEGVVSWEGPRYRFDADGVCVGREPRVITPGPVALDAAEDLLARAYERATAPGAIPEKQGSTGSTNGAEPSGTPVHGTDSPPGRAPF